MRDKRLILWFFIVFEGNKGICKTQQIVNLNRLKTRKNT